MAQHCPECGFVNADAANYCSKCGAYLGGGEAGEPATSTYRVGETGELIPVELDAEVASQDGEAVVRSVDGTVAGLPADPLVAALAAAIARRL